MQRPFSVIDKSGCWWFATYLATPMLFSVYYCLTAVGRVVNHYVLMCVLYSALDVVHFPAVSVNVSG